MTSNPFHDGEDGKPEVGFAVTGPIERAGALVLQLEGEFDLATAPLFDEAAQALPAHRRLIVDLSAVDYIDSSGIAALIRADARLREFGGRLECVVPPEGAVRKVFELVRLGETFDVCEELPEE
jgi:anti-sigma B factor antagonist